MCAPPTDVKLGKKYLSSSTLFPARRIMQPIVVLNASVDALSIATRRARMCVHSHLMFVSSLFEYSHPLPSLIDFFRFPCMSNLFVFYIVFGASPT